MFPVIGHQIADVKCTIEGSACSILLPVPRSRTLSKHAWEIPNSGGKDRQLESESSQTMESLSRRIPFLKSRGEFSQTIERSCTKDLERKAPKDDKNQAGKSQNGVVRRLATPGKGRYPSMECQNDVLANRSS